MGYIGGRLAKFLVGAGHEVYLGSRQLLSPPRWCPEARMVQMQWEDDAALASVCRGMDVVVHTAGMNAQDCAQNPRAALNFNGVCTERLVNAAIHQDVSRFIYFSTAHVYASPLVGIINEKTIPTNTHPYATTHRAGEDFVLSAASNKQIDGCVIRLSNAFGAPMYANVNCWSLLLNDLCRQAVISKKMVLHSSGLQRRDFIPMADVCRAIAYLLFLPASRRESLELNYSQSPSKDTVIPSQPIFNLGGLWSPTVWEIASLLQLRCEEVLGFRPSLARLEATLGEQSAQLEYKMDSLSQMGFKLKKDPVFELDQLLLFCNHVFA